MNLFYLRYFVTLAKVQHYTKAAEQLCIAQPSLSHAITQLEKELGVPLFEKNGRRTVLTRFGEEFLVCAEKTLATLDEGMTSIQRSARGEGLIRLGFIRPLGVEFIPALASEFLKRNGDLEVQFTFHTGDTAQLLDGLKERNVGATFFVTGENAENYPEIIRREQEEGHLIGNHTYSHIQLTSRNREAFREELVRTNAVLEEITGEKTSFVRPPYGSWDKSFEKELNMFPVLWNIDPLDWCSHNAECIAARVVEKAGDGDIILMHDYYDTSVIAALEVIDALQGEGFQFVTVEELLFD